jgi:hypothetical protein
MQERVPVSRVPFSLAISCSPYVIELGTRRYRRGSPYNPPACHQRLHSKEHVGLACLLARSCVRFCIQPLQRKHCAFSLH